MKRSRKPWVLAIASVVVVVLMLGGVKAGQIVFMVKASAKFAPPPESVSSARVEAGEWVATRAAVGTLVASRGVTLSSELPGLVREISFQSGSSVRKGAVLVKLDTSTEEAQLQAALAEAALAGVSLERARALRQGESSSQADLDAAEARAKQTRAAAAALQATIAKKTIRAPFDGRISIRQVELGQVLAPGTPIASLQSVSPIHADFWLPQQALADLNPGEEVRLRADPFPGARWDGTITTVNPEVDVATRNVRVRATFANPDGRLRPGMFASVEVLSSERRPVVVIPATAVIFAPYGDSVYAIEQGKTPGGVATTVARQRFVRLGERRGDFVSVLSGLSPGETIVSSGAFKLRNGTAVALTASTAPGAQLAPRPRDD